MRRLVASVVGAVVASAIAGLASADVKVAREAFRNGDFATALREYLPHARDGDAAAQYGLGLMYQSGQGVRQDLAEAAKWYLLAADRGHFDAQMTIGQMYAGGLGVPKDAVRAHKWFNLASKTGDRGALEERDYLEDKMTADQIQEARKLALEWARSNTNRP